MVFFSQFLSHTLIDSSRILESLTDFRSISLSLLFSSSRRYVFSSLLPFSLKIDLLLLLLYFFPLGNFFLSRHRLLRQLLLRSRYFFSIHQVRIKNVFRSFNFLLTRDEEEERERKEGKQQLYVVDVVNSHFSIKNLSCGMRLLSDPTQGGNSVFPSPKKIVYPQWLASDPHLHSVILLFLLLSMLSPEDVMSQKIQTD